MKHLAITIATSAGVFAAIPAQAESFQLFSKGHWSVSYVVEGDIEACVASVEAKEIYFSLDVTSDGLNAWFIDVDNNFGDTLQQGSVAVWVDGRRKWETPATALESSVRMFGLSSDFLREIVDGQRLYIDDNFDGEWDAWFSLNGSAAAVMALADCSEKLGGMTS